MTDRRLLTGDRLVRESRFASGWVVICNFGPEARYTTEGKKVEPKGYRGYPWR